MRFSRQIARWTPIFILTALILPPAAAKEKTDVIILKNGDHVTGEILKLERGMLTLKTDSMGTVEIKWGDIEQITSRYQFTVEVTHGDFYVGSLEAPAEPRYVNVIGPKPAGDLSLRSVVGIREVEASLWQRFSGSVGFGYNFSKSSDRRQLNLNSDLTYQAERFDGRFAIDATESESKGEQDVNRRALTLSGSRYIGSRWQVFSLGKFEHNLELQLDSRSSVLAGPAYKVLRTNNSEILLAGGMSYTRERYFEQEGVNNAEGAIGARAQFFKLYTPKVDVIANFFLLPNLTASGRVRLEFDSKVRLEVFRNFYVDFSFYDSYDSKPPSESAVRNDYGFVTGLSWSFRR